MSDPQLAVQRLSAVPDHPPSPYDELVGPLSAVQAMAEANRCLYCHDATCISACPTSIDIPAFIRSIATGDLTGASDTILSANIMGGTCARVCPTETLCEQACVRNTAEARPVAIGRLQRHAVDARIHAVESGAPYPFKRAAATGRRVAVVGAGPAGLACAHALAVAGHEVVVMDARERAGGLNEYGLAPYKMAGDFAAREISFILGIGNITIDHCKRLGRDFALPDLSADYDAVFLGIGLGGTNQLGIAGEDLPHVEDAIRFINRVRDGGPASPPAVGSRVVVIGGGNTAVDAAIQAKRLGADEVTLVYRRGPANMSATPWEQELARSNGVMIRCFATPVAITADHVALERTRIDGHHPQGTGQPISIPADMVLKAVGQRLDEAGLLTACGPELLLSRGKIAVDEGGRTSIAGVYAGGDCIASGEDLTVRSVEDGKRAAAAMIADLASGITKGELGNHG